MMEASFESESIFYQYCPDHIPKPVARVNYESDLLMWFYLCYFYDMAGEVPEPKEFVLVVVQIQKSRMDKSPNGEYGFHVPTHLSNLPNSNTWQKS